MIPVRKHYPIARVTVTTDFDVRYRAADYENIITVIITRTVVYDGRARYDTDPLPRDQFGSSHPFRRSELPGTTE